MSGLHYKKDGTLDMRYSSSREAIRSGSYSSSGSYNYSAASPVVSNSSDLHYKKDGTLDMRYSSSREAAGSGSYNYSTTQSGYSSPVAATPVVSNSSDLHYKKDGTLDMRYSSSKAAVAASPVTSNSPDLHYKKDGTLDMRYNSSKLAQEVQKMDIGSCTPKGNSVVNRKSSIPPNIPLTKKGFPDMRCTEAKKWVQDMAANWNWSNEKLPSWVPKKKDGTPDHNKAITNAFFGACNNAVTPTVFDAQIPPLQDREQYYVGRQLDAGFRTAVHEQRQAEVEIPREVPPVQMVETVKKMLDDLKKAGAEFCAPIPGNVQIIEYRDLTIDGSNELGRGSFGVVMKGQWNGMDVAVKQLHVKQLTRQENKDFANEVKILALLGNQDNIVHLHGYCLNPPALIMEYIQLGNLSYLLHYCSDNQIEAKITDGRIKKRIIVGIVNGMVQLHSAGITHGDLKPQNVLITNDYTAKIVDFGLARLRAKTSSSISSKELDNLDEDGIAKACGTAAYMAPELLDDGKYVNEKTDVYSFGILLNEVVNEQEPYYECLLQFHGKGVMAATMHAKAGHRPAVNSKVPEPIKTLVQACWNPEPLLRPPFNSIAKMLRTLQFPNSF